MSLVMLSVLEMSAGVKVLPVPLIVAFSTTCLVIVLRIMRTFVESPPP